MFISNAFAQTEVAAVAAGFNWIGTVFYIIALGILFFFLFIRPQRKQMLMHKQIIESLKVGDEVLTNSGIVATIKKIKEKEFVIEIAKGVEVTILKAYIVGKV